MKIFNLPDLGEGLADAELHEWYIKEGDYIELDQPMVAIETAKALVDIPSPQSGYIVKLYAQPGDIVDTGGPLVQFSPHPLPPASQGEEKLRGTRRSMASNIIKSQAEGAPSMLCEDADIHAWGEKEDCSLRLIRAMIKACQAEPALNTHYFNDTLSRKLFTDINIGIAIDSPTGLYVPVLKNCAHVNPNDMRKQINQFKYKAQNQSFSLESLAGATIVLSNFGSIGGRYALPSLISPIVSIIAAGRSREEVVVVEGKPAVRRIIPLTLAFDHRAVTGGEAARFLMAMIKDLSLKI